MGGTGNIRTLRNQSGTVGYRTLGSILANGSGAGSTRRLYGHYAALGQQSLFFKLFIGK
jgi:hypothetical protein